VGKDVGSEYVRMNIIDAPPLDGTRRGSVVDALNRKLSLHERRGKMIGR